MWEIAVLLAVAGDVFDGVFLCCPFSPRGVLDEICVLIESVSEGFPSYSEQTDPLEAKNARNNRK